MDEHLWNSPSDRKQPSQLQLTVNPLYSMFNFLVASSLFQALLTFALLQEITELYLAWLAMCLQSEEGPWRRPVVQNSGHKVAVVL